MMSHPTVCQCYVSFMPVLAGRLDWHVIQPSQKQELLGTYMFRVCEEAIIVPFCPRLFITSSDSIHVANCIPL